MKSIKAEYLPGGAKRQELLDQVPGYLASPGADQGTKHMFCLDVLKLTETEYLEALNKATNGGVVEVSMELNTTAPEFKIIEDNKDEPDLKTAQDFVGGMVECITFPNGDVLIVNEEGKLMSLPLNPEGTALWRSTFTKDKYAFGYDDWVSGPAILIKHKALKNWA
jgi:hypothetical protein